MKVLICCDYSSAGKYILQEARKFLSAYPEVEVHVFNVMDISIISVGSMYNNNEVIKILENEAGQIKQWAENIFKEKATYFSTEVGYPAEMVVKKASAMNVDLLIVGTHGRTGFGRVLLGSVAAHVVRHAPCKTLIIPIEHLKNE